MRKNRIHKFIPHLVIPRPLGQGCRGAIKNSLRKPRPCLSGRQALGRGAGFIQSTAEKVLLKKDIIPKEAERLLHTKKEDLMFLLAWANIIRRHFRKDKVDLCAIINAKSGACPEDCAFCAQSIFFNTDIETYPLLSTEEIFRRAKKAEFARARRFCIVTSGRGIVSDKDFSIILKAITKIRNRLNILVDVSLGEISFDKAKTLKEAGVSRYNHNIETSESYFSSICSTHTFNDRLNTIHNIKKADLELCCGGIFGLGESFKHRLEFALCLKEIKPDCIPLNFLNPIPETPLAKNKPLAPLDLLKLIAVFRFILPDKEIRVCGGRQKNLRSLQSLIFFAGSDSMITGDYLTTKGSLPTEDIQMIKDLQLNVWQ